MPRCASWPWPGCAGRGCCRQHDVTRALGGWALRPWSRVRNSRAAAGSMTRRSWAPPHQPSAVSVAPWRACKYKSSHSVAYMQLLHTQAASRPRWGGAQRTGQRHAGNSMPTLLAPPPPSLLLAACHAHCAAQDARQPATGCPPAASPAGQGRHQDAHQPAAARQLPHRQLRAQVERGHHQVQRALRQLPFSCQLDDACSTEGARASAWARQLRSAWAWTLIHT